MVRAGRPATQTRVFAVPKSIAIFLRIILAHYIDNFQPQQGGECYTLLVTKIRLLVITLTILIVGSLGYLATLYAREFWLLSPTPPAPKFL